MRERSGAFSRSSSISGQTRYVPSGTGAMNPPRHAIPVRSPAATPCALTHSPIVFVRSRCCRIIGGQVHLFGGCELEPR